MALSALSVLRSASILFAALSDRIALSYWSLALVSMLHAKKTL